MFNAPVSQRIINFKIRFAINVNGTLIQIELKGKCCNAECIEQISKNMNKLVKK